MVIDVDAVQRVVTVLTKMVYGPAVNPLNVGEG